MTSAKIPSVLKIFSCSEQVALKPGGQRFSCHFVTACHITQQISQVPGTNGSDYINLFVAPEHEMLELLWNNLLE